MAVVVLADVHDGLDGSAARDGSAPLGGQTVVADVLDAFRFASQSDGRPASISLKLSRQKFKSHSRYRHPRRFPDWIVSKFD